MGILQQLILSRLSKKDKKKKKKVDSLVLPGQNIILVISSMRDVSNGTSNGKKGESNPVQSEVEC